MKKLLVLLFVGICSVTLVAGPHGHHGGHHHHHHYHHGGGGLWTARQIVGIVADGVRIANGVGYYNYPYYQTPVVYQPAPVVYTQPQTVVYQQPVQYVQPQTVIVQPQPQTVVVQQPAVQTQEVIYVRPRREFIVTRVLRAILE